MKNWFKEIFKRKLKSTNGGFDNNGTINRLHNFVADRNASVKISSAPVGTWWKRVKFPLVVLVVLVLLPVGTWWKRVKFPFSYPVVKIMGGLEGV
ncbi:hypothetical protein AGMMS49532_07430 [Endomicrobiia bacterium]|nr:hypothetical protein AGMMS49532_07430 [Endomicrobiia bacterium]